MHDANFFPPSPPPFVYIILHPLSSIVSSHIFNRSPCQTAVTVELPLPMYFRKQPYVEYPDGFDTKLEVGQVLLLQDFLDDGVSGGT